MRAECVPIIKLTVEPMVMNIVQSMGIENSDLAKVIEEEAKKAFYKKLKEIPEIVNQEVNNLTKELIHEECDSWVRSKYGNKFIHDNPKWLIDFKSEVKTQVSIAISDLTNKKGKLFK